MSNISSSLIPVDKAKITKACANAIEWVHLERMKRYKREIEDAMEPRWNWFWLGKSTRTREEAEKYVDTIPDDFCGAMHYYTFSYKHWNSNVITRAELMMRSIKICDGNVAYLTIDDANFVSAHQEDRT